MRNFYLLGSFPIGLPDNNLSFFLPNCSRCVRILLSHVAFFLVSMEVLAQPPAQPALTIKNDFAEYGIGVDGHNLHFIDRQANAEYVNTKVKAPCARIKKAGKEYAATKVTHADGLLTMEFGHSGVTATIQVVKKSRYFVFEVKEVRGDGVQEFQFVDIPLTLKGKSEEPFAACALALNLQTNVRELPGASSRLRAICYPRFGFAGAKVALIGCPPKELRKVMQEVVTESPDLPHSPIGGPWALDSEDNRGSYLFNFGDLSEDKVDDWIKLAKSLGITQIDFHGGSSFRFGDCQPNPKTYPKGWASFKAVIDKLHAANLKAGLHTYSQFLDKRTPWITPVPDPRLGKDATFTLAKDLPPEATTVFVAEPTQDMSAITGFFVRNSVTLQIDDELITYGAVGKEVPFSFGGCKRGAFGTRATSHPKNAKVHHLKECFGLFVPDGDSTLFTEVAAKTAEAFNAGGFDMIYLDALDGSDIFGGWENTWHYQSKFAFEIFKRLHKPAMMEMSTFSHHLWYVRSRMGAWDHPRRAHKKFIDLHVAANEDNLRMFLPGQLGWWAVQTWTGPQGEPTFSDDIEYLMGQCLATGNGFALMGVDPGNIDKIHAYPRLAGIMRQYEKLRHANYFSDQVKAKLRTPGQEFTLVKSPQGEWQFREASFDRHKVAGLDGRSDSWLVTNKFQPQPIKLRIEALMSAQAYDSPGQILLADCASVKDFTDGGARPGVISRFEPSSEQVKVGPASGRFTAKNNGQTSRGAWAKAGKLFEPPLNLLGHEALGVWVHGDGKGAILNLQLLSPHHLVSGIADHYLTLDFKGWRYFELIEPEGQRFADYSWPYGDPYSIYRESIAHGAVSRLNLFLNNLPVKESVTCYISPVRALPTIKGKWRNPVVTVGDKTLVFPVTLESGCYLEFQSPTDCKHYGPKGEFLGEIKVSGDVPVFYPGSNRLKFSCENLAAGQPRAYVTMVTHGGVLSGVNPANKLVE